MNNRRFFLSFCFYTILCMLNARCVALRLILKMVVVLVWFESGNTVFNGYAIFRNGSFGLFMLSETKKTNCLKYCNDSTFWTITKVKTVFYGSFSAMIGYLLDLRI